MRDALGLAGLVLLVAWIVLHLAGCGPSADAKAIAAEAAYGAEHMRCVSTYETNAEIDDCRERVRVRWGITTTLRDAGGDR